MLVAMRPRFTWKLASRSLELGARTLVMGIVNVTPDSFSDGGEFISHDRAVLHALRLLEQGADILDIGGESTRPGKKDPVSEMVEMERVLPVIESLHRQKPEAVISVDTYRSTTAAAAIDAGAEIVNDVSGFQWDSNMADVIAGLGCGAVLMHMRGRPETWHSLPPLADPMETVKKELAYYAAVALKFGIPRESLVLDPGFGFGKSFEENYPLLARLEELQPLGFPLLAGASRKSFVGRMLARLDESGKLQDAPVDQRLYGSIAAAVIAAMHGAHILRVHDVQEPVEALRVVDTMMGNL